MSNPSLRKTINKWTIIWLSIGQITFFCQILAYKSIHITTHLAISFHAMSKKHFQKLVYGPKFQIKHPHIHIPFRPDHIHAQIWKGLSEVKKYSWCKKNYSIHLVESVLQSNLYQLSGQNQNISIISESVIVPIVTIRDKFTCDKMGCSCKTAVVELMYCKNRIIQKTRNNKK